MQTPHKLLCVRVFVYLCMRIYVYAVCVHFICFLTFVFLFNLKDELYI